MSGPLIIGPGSKGQFSDVTSFYCGDCGVVYKFLPSVKKEKEQ